jgi:hypothetical protein
MIPQFPTLGQRLGQRYFNFPSLILLFPRYPQELDFHCPIVPKCTRATTRFRYRVGIFLSLPDMLRFPIFGTRYFILYYYFVHLSSNYKSGSNAPDLMLSQTLSQPCPTVGQWDHDPSFRLVPPEIDPRIRRPT